VRVALTFFLLTAVFAVLVAGCGGSEKKPPEEVVSAWSQALSAGDNEAAADLFADGAVVIQEGRQQTLNDHEDAVSFNSSLPCGAKVVKQSTKGDEVTATFTLTRRPGPMCDDTGATAVTVFSVEDGKITLWHQLPSGDAPTQSA
jgi:limonene-1,2-epoxide hydrolase